MVFEDSGKDVFCSQKQAGRTKTGRWVGGLVENAWVVGEKMVWDGSFGGG